MHSPQHSSRPQRTLRQFSLSSNRLAVVRFGPSVRPATSLFSSFIFQSWHAPCTYFGLSALAPTFMREKS